MKLLAVDTATEICGIALAENGRVTAELILDRGETHTRSIMEAVQAVLSADRLRISQIDVFAVTRGPGSFTGLRIGISTVKGLAAAGGKPVVGISSLAVLAHQAAVGTPLVCPLMDARRKEVYWRLYRRNGHLLKPLDKEQVGPAGDIVSAVAESCLFIGNGVAQYRSTIERGLENLAVFAGKNENNIRPAVLAQLAWDRYQTGGWDDLDSFSPVYLRKSDVEQ